MREGDELVDVVITKPGDNVLLASAAGMAIRFDESDARPMGRNSSGVRGIRLTAGDQLVGMVVCEPKATLLTACANGYGKRTLFGASGAADENETEDASSTSRYRTQKRGGKGVRDIKTTQRNGPVIGITRVTDDDEIIMMTRGGKLQRIAASDIGVIGRNTQGVRIMSMDDDTLVAVVRVPRDTNGDGHDDEDGSENGPSSPAEVLTDTATDSASQKPAPQKPAPQKPAPQKPAENEPASDGPAVDSPETDTEDDA